MACRLLLIAALICIGVGPSLIQAIPSPFFETHKAPKHLTKNIDNHLERKLQVSQESIHRGVSRADECPAAADISPCVCSILETGLSLDCSALESDDQLVSVFQAEFPSKEFNDFKFYDNGDIQSLAGTTNGVSFVVMDIQGNDQLTTISADFMQDSTTTLVYFRIDSSAITAEGVPFDSLSQSGALRFLYLTYSPNLQSLPMLVSDSIEEINFHDAGITAIEPGTFDGMTALEILNLGYGEFQTLSAGSFPLTNSMKNLFLSGGSVAAIEPGALYLPDGIEPTALEIQIQFGASYLTELKTGTFPLSDRWVNIYLFSNQISSIEPGTFVMPQTTDFLRIVVDLNNNEISTLDEEVFGEIFPYMHLFYIYSNPLECGCDMAWLILNEDYMAITDDYAACANGTNLHVLDPIYYQDNC